MFSLSPLLLFWLCFHLLLSNYWNYFPISSLSLIYTAYKILIKPKSNYTTFLLKILCSPLKLKVQTSWTSVWRLSRGLPGFPVAPGLTCFSSTLAIVSGSSLPPGDPLPHTCELRCHNQSPSCPGSPLTSPPPCLPPSASPHSILHPSGFETSLPETWISPPSQPADKLTPSGTSRPFTGPCPNPRVRVHQATSQHSPLLSIPPAMSRYRNEATSSPRFPPIPAHPRPQPGTMSPTAGSIPQPAPPPALAPDSHIPTFHSRSLFRNVEEKGNMDKTMD